MSAMSDIEIKLISSGVRELLRSDEIAAVCREQAEAVKSRCGAGYTVDTYMGASRVNCSVSADSKGARKDNLKNNTLLKAMK